MLKRLLTLSIMLAALAGAVPGHAYANCDPRTPPSAPKTEDLGGDFANVTGHWMAPANNADPTTLIVFFHGYGNDSSSWICHMVDASNHGALSFGLDYTGTGWPGPNNDQPPSNDRGWFVREGALDSMALARYFLDTYPTINRVIAFGISMGGNSSGYAVAQGATRADGTPLFDYWFDVEGVTNLTEEYVLASAVAPANAYAQGAVEDINKECGDNYTNNALCLSALTVTAHAQAIASFTKGLVVVHGVDDGLVPTNQSRELSTAVRALGTPVEQYTVLRRNDCPDDDAQCIKDQGGTTLSENVGTPLFAQLGLGPYPRPLAGHGWEGSDSQLVIKTGFDRLWDLVDNQDAVPQNAEFVVDSGIGTLP
ncbi:MAG: alpha/beta hydrolase family protein [Actinomycetota bacterium]